MEKYLLTQSLLSAYNYIFDCYEGYEVDAYADFLKVLNRERTATNEVMQKGIDFENEVYDFTKLVEKEFSSDVIEIGKIVKGCQWQVKAYKEKEIDGINFLLYAKCDCVKAGEIFDIKRSDSYEVGKYLNSAQHPMYFECVPASKFTYLISDGKDVFKECYTREETPKIDEFVRNFINFLKNERLIDIFFDKWRA